MAVHFSSGSGAFEVINFNHFSTRNSFTRKTSNLFAWNKRFLWSFSSYSTLELSRWVCETSWKSLFEEWILTGKRAVTVSKRSFLFSSDSFSLHDIFMEKIIYSKIQCRRYSIKNTRWRETHAKKLIKLHNVAAFSDRGNEGDNKLNQKLILKRSLKPRMNYVWVYRSNSKRLLHSLQ